jgi:hypothetical protein
LGFGALLILAVLQDEARLVVEERNVAGMLSEVAELERLGRTPVESEQWAEVSAARREVALAEAKRWREQTPQEQELEALQAQLEASRVRRAQVTAASKTLAARIGQAAMTPEAIKASEWSDKFGTDYLPNQQRNTKKARKK